MAALVASGCSVREVADASVTNGVGYGPLTPDPAGLVDLPHGFSYRVISKLGDAMNDGGTVPDAADGMGCFDLGNGKLALVRNHELILTQGSGGEIAKGFGRWNGRFVPGGTTSIILDAKTLEVEHQFRSLGGTIRNCAGGTTPWGSWLTCEEAVTGPGQRYGDGLDRNHGWVFEVPADASEIIDPVPLKAMGRFNHEAACVDPVTGIVYLTEDRDDSLLYRFLPNSPGILAEGGKLQALVLGDVKDTRNWDSVQIALGDPLTGSWIDMDDVEAPGDDLRQRGAARGAAVFARGEGIWMGDGELYFACTSGGLAKLGQIFRLKPGRGELSDKLELFYESTSPDQFNYGDNLTIAPDGQLVVCEDQYGAIVKNYIRGITTGGEAYPIAFLDAQTEWAGACFSPDGGTLFVNVYSPAKTLAITGPWQHLG
ncbi:alkaline phosphatase PhoX [Altererythrobacter sp. MF3-039]|uniref:alkaline phosphatase PhoX n=1 Tax=Altererythrobacter sp. MF3-039 TaxID=3252901 RepID=UPI00390C5743